MKQIITLMNIYVKSEKDLTNARDYIERAILNGEIRLRVCCAAADRKCIHLTATYDEQIYNIRVTRIDNQEISSHYENSPFWRLPSSVKAECVSVIKDFIKKAFDNDKCT